MGSLEDDARRIANQRAETERVARQARHAAAQRLASMHPWNIEVDSSAQALLHEFARSATRLVHSLPFLVFRGVPRPSGDPSYSKGDRTGLEGWCLFATRQNENEEISGLFSRISVLGMTTNAQLVRVDGLVEKGTYTDTGFFGPKVAICLPPRPPNPYHGQIINADTPINSAHVTISPPRGYHDDSYLRYPSRPLRHVLAYNLAAMMHRNHPQQTGSWKF